MPISRKFDAQATAFARSRVDSNFGTAMDPNMETMAITTIISVSENARSRRSEVVLVFMVQMSLENAATLHRAIGGGKQEIT